VHLVEERGQLLHLVDDDPGAGTSTVPNERLEERGIRGQPIGEIRPEEIDHEGAIGELGRHEEALPRGPRSEEEEGLAGEEILEVQDAGEDRHRSC
jgi:hypothetical protein